MKDTIPLYTNKVIPWISCANIASLILPYLCIFLEYDLHARCPSVLNEMHQDAQVRVWCHSIYAYLRT